MPAKIFIYEDQNGFERLIYEVLENNLSSSSEILTSFTSGLRLLNRCNIQAHVLGDPDVVSHARHPGTLHSATDFARAGSLSESQSSHHQ